MARFMHRLHAALFARPRFRRRHRQRWRTAAAAALAIGAPALWFNAAEGAPKLRLVNVATADSPIGFALHPTGSMFVVEQGGKLRSFSGTKVGNTVLDVSEEISNGGEQGLLGAVFSNDGTWLFVNLTNNDGDSEIRAYPFALGVADRDRMVLVLKVDQPYSNHNGGSLVLDSSGVLWIGFGDGGSGGDPEGRAQNLNTHLGKILRIIPTPDDASPYRIAPGNIDSAKGKPEIWAFGLRNPWRFAVDEKTNTVWIGDVGQGEREEINAVRIGARTPNFGWNLREGTRAYSGRKRPAGSIDPVYDYSHATGGCSVTGGVVYHGTAIRALSKTYLFSDFCDGKIRLVRTGVTTGRVTVQNSGLKLKGASSFGTDAKGEIYIASREGTIAKITG